MKNILFELWGEELHESRSSQLQTQLLQLQKERLKKIQACTGFEPLTSVIPVQGSYKLSYKQTGSRSLYVNCRVNQNHMKVDHRIASQMQLLQFFFFWLSFCNCSVVISTPAYTISNSKHETSVAPSAIIDRNPRDLS